MMDNSRYGADSIGSNSASRDVLSNGITSIQLENNSRLEAYIKRLNQVSHRLTGPRPTDPKGQPGAVTPMAPTLIMRLEQGNSANSHLLDELDSVVNALENFI